MTSTKRSVTLAPELTIRSACEPAPTAVGVEERMMTRSKVTGDVMPWISMPPAAPWMVARDDAEADRLKLES